MEYCPKFKIKKKLTEKNAGELFILSDNEKSMFIINEVGSRIVELADGKRKLEEINAILSREYAFDKNKIEEDTSCFLKKMKRLGYLES